MANNGYLHVSKTCDIIEAILQLVGCFTVQKETTDIQNKSLHTWHGAVTCRCNKYHSQWNKFTQFTVKTQEDKYSLCSPTSRMYNILEHATKESTGYRSDPVRTLNVWYQKDPNRNYSWLTFVFVSILLKRHIIFFINQCFPSDQMNLTESTVHQHRKDFGVMARVADS